MESYIFALWIICAIIGANMAKNRHRSHVGGFFLGLLLGLIGLAILALMGDAKEKKEAKVEKASTLNND